jgi:hypothetical protein
MDGKKKITAAEARELTGNVYLDRVETAAYMGISEKWLATHRFDGPTMLKVGNKALYRLKDIENYMRQQEMRR